MERKIKNPLTGEEYYASDEEQSKPNTDALRQLQYITNKVGRLPTQKTADDAVKELAKINIKLWVIIFVFIFLPIIKDLLNDLF